MLTILKLQLKTALRDKVVIISILLPIFMAVLLRINMPDTVIIEAQVAVNNNDLPIETIRKIEKVAVVNRFNNIEEIKNRVLISKDEVVGIITDDTVGQCKFIFEGNETTRTIKNMEAIGDLINDNISLDKTQVEVISSDNNEMKYMLIIITMLIALYMGSTFIAFNIVGEKEEGIANINQILPISNNKYNLQKVLLGLIGTVVITFITGLILIDKDNFSYLFLFLFVSACCSSSLGLYLGFFSKDLLSAIINTKVVLLVFILIPFIGFIIPEKLNTLKKLFYLIPTYPIFEGFWCILKYGDVSAMMFNMGIVFLHTSAAYLLYFCILNRCGETYHK